jgi:hypothetical protein
MVALDDNHDPIYGPWEDKANAEKRKNDVLSTDTVVSAKVESR